VSNVTNTDKIRRLEVTLATLEERVANLREELKRYEGVAVEIDKRLRVVESSSTTIDHRLCQAEKKLSESSSRRWELLRLILAAVLGSALTFGAGQLNSWVNSQRPGPKQLEPAQPQAGPKH
jgi:septal ring factor EnvC (AmiA/AmiB activator)